MIPTTAVATAGWGPASLGLRRRRHRAAAAFAAAAA